MILGARGHVSAGEAATDLENCTTLESLSCGLNTPKAVRIGDDGDALASTIADTLSHSA